MVGGAVLGLALGTGVVRVPCWFRLLTGLDCPFCGGSRALGALLEGDLAGAIVSGADHFVPEQQPDEVAELIRRFVA